MAYAAEARSGALGRTLAVGSVADLDFPSIWSIDSSGHNYSNRKWHSAQFRSTNMRQKDYWHTLLSGEVFGIQ